MSDFWLGFFVGSWIVLLIRLIQVQKKLKKLEREVSV